MKKTAHALLICTALAACAAPQATQQAMQQTAAKTVFDPAQAAGKSLGPQNLTPGACGLFLWGQGAGRPLQLFQNSKTQAVTVPFKSGAAITRISAEKPVMDGLFAHQVFKVDDISMDVSFDVEAGRNVLKGVAIPGGRIVLREPSGRETIIPIIGLFGCRN